ncbi:PASTA domain-containing protein [Breznakiella homolactica]|uniref:PASTA domain-containing protein n=1 Tax=Breznakiella homolactica TaxID=2798577 RepID=A0A7T7XMB9_9SPIR|nr:PASTA domain-containing protein [Breznakiella homolactica]QQO08936.1 PASTA domain-containing protein [Breznakiella homolactica]
MGKRFDFDFDAIESYVASHARLFVSLVIGIIVLVGLVALTVFFVAVRGAEQTMVPDIRGKDLTEALLELQVKELYPRIQLRYSQTSQDKGTILEQEPAGGTIVKAGRRIRLVVSQGVIMDRVEDYVGRDLDEVRMDLQALFASAVQPLLSLKEPFMYEFSSEPPGTILQQNPLPGADISGPTALEFVVSRGPENTMIKIPDLVGLPVADALEQLRQNGVAFTFTIRNIRPGESPETIVYQNPTGQSVVESNVRLALVASTPLTLETGEVFDLFSYTLPENPYPLAVRLEAVLPSGERRRIASVDHPGGEFSVPYRLPVGSVLILSMVNREMHRETVQYPASDTMPYEQF